MRTLQAEEAAGRVGGTTAFALRELNNPEDVEPIEAALGEAGLE